ncbi:MAG: TetR/AcrR family transcriptional regulator [Dehalococcoidia bacterium]
MDAEKSYWSKIKARSEAKEQILEAASDLIREGGSYYVTLDQIADRLHISKVSIYHHWTSKQGILFDLLSIGYKAFVENLTKIARSNDPPDVKLRKAIENHVEQAVNSPINPMLKDKEWRLVNKYRKEIIELRDAYSQMFYEIIEDGIKEGIFRKVDPRLVHFTIMGATNYTWLWYSRKGRLPYKQIAANITDYLLNGILAGSPGKRK